mmetsp:Transcript_12833/g.25660  ORF Transcript_12833/g.25660 Transcript_12833/m.25660 type:complete len:400 (+) Transcript_12833:693-1892(+)
MPPSRTPPICCSICCVACSYDGIKVFVIVSLKAATIVSCALSDVASTTPLALVLRPSLTPFPTAAWTTLAIDTSAASVTHAVTAGTTAARTSCATAFCTSRAIAASRDDAYPSRARRTAFSTSFAESVGGAGATDAGEEVTGSREARGCGVLANMAGAATAADDLTRMGTGAAAAPSSRFSIARGDRSAWLTSEEEGCWTGLLFCLLGCFFPLARLGEWPPGFGEWPARFGERSPRFGERPDLGGRFGEGGATSGGEAGRPIFQSSGEGSAGGGSPADPSPAAFVPSPGPGFPAGPFATPRKSMGDRKSSSDPPPSSGAAVGNSVCTAGSADIDCVGMGWEASCGASTPSSPTMLPSQLAKASGAAFASPSGSTGAGGGATAVGLGVVAASNPSSSSAS